MKKGGLVKRVKNWLYMLYKAIECHELTRYKKEITLAWDKYGMRMDESEFDKIRIRLDNRLRFVRGWAHKLFVW